MTSKQWSIKNKPGHLILAALLLTPLVYPAVAGEIEESFARPGESSKPACYWYWMFGNVATNALAEELQLMRRTGIGEAFVGDIWTRQNDAEPGPVTALSPGWWDALTFAVREGARRGVRVGVFNAPGWSMSGGPWVKPEQAMRYLLQTETLIEGPQHFEGKLPAPEGSYPAPKGPIQDVAVLAVPVPAADMDTAARRRPVVKSEPVVAAAERLFDGALTESVQLHTNHTFELVFEKPFTARSLVLHLGEPSAVSGKIEVAGVSGGWETVRTFAMDAEWAALTRVETANLRGPLQGRPKVFALPATTSRQFRITIGGLGGARRFTEIELLAAPRIEYVAQKQLGYLISIGSPKWDAFHWPPQPEADEPALVTSPDAVLNLTGKMSADGTLRWDAPPGAWLVQRIAMAPTGTQNMPSAPSGRGLEVDKMSRAHARSHVAAFIGELERRLGPEGKHLLGRVIADSYEVGPQNWTDDFVPAFKTLRGYDPTPWLPVLAGRVVGSVDRSHRFLWDLRRTIADRVATEYVGGLREACRERGHTLWLENYGHWGFPGEFLQYGGQAEGIGGEVWVGRFNEYELRCAVSAAAIYGKRIVSAETFTGGPQFSSTPRSLKTLGDFAFCQGINHIVLHVFMHQPWDERRPGINAWFGTEFTRHNPWMALAEPWVSYLRRCSEVLQRGWRVADVAYFIGEDTPIMTGPQIPALPAGYDYDAMNAEVLMNKLSVREGRFELPHGASYRVLVLPPLETMRPSTLRKIRDLARAGGKIVGSLPQRSPSLQDYPRCDVEVRKLAAEIGSVSTNLAAAIAVEPDVVAGSLRWTHRRDGETDIYFLSNPQEAAVVVEPTFRVSGKRPELWDAVTGRVAPATGWSVRQGRTSVPLSLPANGSIFVVFRSPGSPEETPKASPLPTTSLPVNGPWEVSFPPGLGAPARARFDKLVLWNEHETPTIRYFSGVATYRAKFHLPAAGRVILNLGRVESVARVIVNGTSLGELWTEPYETDVTSAVKAGENTLELQIANTWRNALIGAVKHTDGLAGAAGPYLKPWTSRNPGFTPKSPLQASGLLGPVTLRIEGANK